MRKLLLACISAAALSGAAACDATTDPTDQGVPQDLSFAPCVGGDATPSWFAAQDGDGSWNRVTESAAGSFDFTFSSGRGGIAYYDPDNGLLVMYATTDELKANMPSCNGGVVRTLTGQVTGYVSADNISLVAGLRSANVFGNTSPAPASYAILDIDPSVSDLIGVKYRLAGGSVGTAFEAFPTGIFLRRGVTGTSTSTVDFGSATEAGAPLQRTLTVTNLSAGEELSILSYVALSTTMANIAEYDAPAALVTGPTTAPFYGVPASRLNAGETHMLHVDAHAIVSSSSETNRFATTLFTDPADRSVTFGPVLGSVTVNGTSRPSASYTIQTGYDGLFDVVFSQGNSTNFRQVEILATKGYVGSGSSVTLAVPNLSGTAGFSSTWLLNTGVSSTWTFLATDAGLGVLNGGPITYQGADRSGVFTP
jgi:hypothetical protein